MQYGYRAIGSGKAGNTSGFPGVGIETLAAQPGRRDAGRRDRAAGPGWEAVGAREEKFVGRCCSLLTGMRYFILLVFVLAVSSCAAKLIDIDECLPKLYLSEEQQEVVRPKMEAIKQIADEYDADKERFGESAESTKGGAGNGGRGNRGQMRERLQEFRKKREAYVSAIDVHVADIKAVLDEEQLVAFEKMELPELEMPEIQGGRRGGMGGGPGGRGGGARKGGGGGRRGGGMF